MISTNTTPARIVSLLVLCLIAFTADAQTSKPNKKASFFVTAGAGWASFLINKENTPDFGQPDIRFGFGIAKPLAKRISLYTRLNVGYRFPNPEKTVDFSSGRPWPNSWLYEVPQRQHWFFEVPLIVHYHFLRPGISLGVGALYNMIVKSGTNITFTDNRNDVGVVGRVAWRANRSFEIGGEYYRGMITMLETSYSVSNPDYLSVRNQFAQVFVNYYLPFPRLRLSL
jgi:hypothetical protein